jgi:hypothetical protein
MSEWSPIQTSAYVVLHSLLRSTRQWHLFASNLGVSEQFETAFELPRTMHLMHD